MTSTDQARHETPDTVEEKTFTKSFTNWNTADQWMDQVERNGTARIVGYTQESGKTVVTYAPDKNEPLH